MTLYETHLPVSDLARSVAFYREIVGLKPAFEQRERGVAFMWIGAKHVGMLGLWRPGTLFGWKRTQRHSAHLAIAMPLRSTIAALHRLQRRGVGIQNFVGKFTNEFSVIGWMPAVQFYFDDPDGHSVEFVTILRERPAPDFCGTWSAWRRRRKKP